MYVCIELLYIVVLLYSSTTIELLYMLCMQQPYKGLSPRAAVLAKTGVEGSFCTQNLMQVKEPILMHFWEEGSLCRTVASCRRVF